MIARKALAVLAIGIGGAAALFAVYAFGWRDDANDRESRGGVHVYKLRDGDVVLRQEASTRCEASSQGGKANLFCTRIAGGRHQVIFYSDAVLIWPLDCGTCGPGGPVFDYRWEPGSSRAGPHPAVTTKVLATSPVGGHPPWSNGDFWLGDYIWLYARSPEIGSGLYRAYRVCWRYPAFRLGACRAGSLGRLWSPGPQRLRATHNDQLVVTWYVDGKRVAVRKLRITGE